MNSNTSTHSGWWELNGILEKLQNANSTVYTMYECLSRSDLGGSGYASAVLGIYEHFQLLLENMQIHVDALKTQREERE